MPSTQDLEKTTYTRFALLLIVIGGLVALEIHFKIPHFHKLWPLLTIVLGIGLIGVHIKRKSNSSLYLGAGEYIIGFSGLALYCNFTSWAHMAKLWPVFIALLGIVFITMFIMNKQKRIALFLGMVLISLAVFFYFVFGLDVRYWWTIFVLVGASILVSVRIP